MKYRFSASLEAGSATTPSPLPRPASLTKHHVQLTRPTTPATSATRRHSTAEWPTGRESHRRHVVRDRTGQVLPAAMLGTVPMTDAPYCAVLPNSYSEEQHGVESQVRVPVASKSVYRTNCSLRASAISFRVSVASGFAPAEPPAMARPRHQLSLGSLRCRHTATGTSSAVRTVPCAKLHPRHAQVQAPVSSESARPHHRVSPASARRAGQTCSNQHASGRGRRACHHRSSHVSQDQA